MVAGSTELLPDGMQLDAFSLTDVSGDNKLWKVHVKVVSGNNIPGNAIITGANGSKQCVITSGSSQFCAVSDLTTIIMGRL
jgi:hypothetical protein